MEKLHIMRKMHDLRDTLIADRVELDFKPGAAETLTVWQGDKVVAVYRWLDLEGYAWESAIKDPDAPGEPQEA